MPVTEFANLIVRTALTKERMVPAPNAHSLLEVARSLTRAARTIYDKHGQLWGEDFPAFYFLLGFALELSLKSLLAADGMEDRKLIALGHDLAGALSALAKRGKADALHYRLSDILLAMQQHHLDLHFRYMPRKGRFVAPDPKLSLVVVTSLLDEAAWRLRLIPDV